MTPVQKRKVGIDSNCLTYLIDAMRGVGVEEPIGDQLASEKKALLRAFLYMPEAFYVTATVVSEYASIPDVDFRKLHDAFVGTLFREPEVRNRDAVDARAAQLLQFHDDKADRRILAEAEDLDLDALLTFDKQFLQRLKTESKHVALRTPTEHWEALNIPKGTPPVHVPHPTNPLSQQSWWRW